MKIGILQCGHFPDEARPTLGDYDAMFERLFDGHGFIFTTYNVVDGEFPQGPADEEGWLVTGSRHGAYEDHAWIPPLEDFIRAVAAGDRRMVGICFGHQIIAQALGGRVEKWHGGWNVGAKDYHWCGTPLTLNAWHQDQVTDLPPDTRVLARHPACENAALVIGGTFMTIQPHPEFGRPAMEALATYRSSVLAAEEVAIVRQGLDAAVDNASVADRFAAFLKTGEIS